LSGAEGKRPEEEMSKKTLLLVDDVELFLQLGKTMLQRIDFDIHTARSGTEALEKAYELRPDLVLLDLYMPDKDGDQVCLELKSSPATGHIPVIMLTSEGDGDARSRCLTSGCDDFVAKPLKGDVLNRVVEKHLTVRGRRHKRAHMDLACTLVRGDEKTEAMIRTLSPLGVFVEMDPPPIPGTSYVISFSLPEADEPVSLGAIARWNRKLWEDSPIGSGFEFVEVDREMYDRMSQCVLSVLEKEA
jgi:CheY-like chemotaxis protein